MRSHAILLLVSAAASLTLVGRASAVTAVTGWRQGSASFYGGQPDGMNPSSPSYGTKEGSCGYGVLQKSAWPYWAVGALPTSNSFFKSEPLSGCGECFEIECLEKGPAYGNMPGSCQSDPNKRSIVVQITDSCPECKPDNLDLQALTWAQIADPRPAGGRINIQYRRVECVPPSDLVVNVDNNLASGWLRLQVTSAGGPSNVKAVALSTHGANSWKPATNLFGATWEHPQKPQPPLDLRVTNGAGQSVIARNAISVDETGRISTSVQFKISDPNDVQPSGKVLSGGSSSGGISSAAADGGGQVSAFSGPADPPPAHLARSKSCEDKDPGNGSCQTNKDVGNCDKWWLKAGNYCAKTCGRCGGGGSGGSR